MNFNQSNQNITDDENKCHICDIEFEELELHFFTSHTSQTVPDIIDKKEDDISENINSEVIIETESKINQYSKKMVKNNEISCAGNDKLQKGIYKCNTCYKVFGINYELKRHIKIDHEKVKNFKCQICNKLFPLSNFSNHRIFHEVRNELQNQKHKKWKHDPMSLEKITCTICDKAFSRPSLLKQHTKLIHEEGGQSLMCTLCNKSFSRSDHLNNHKKNVHYGNKIKCDICNNSFSTLGHLRQHEKNVHDGNNHPAMLTSGALCLTFKWFGDF